jgi:hypothetical protein
MTEPSSTPTPAARRPRKRRFLWRALGLLVGAILIVPLFFIGLRCGPFSAVMAQPQPDRDPAFAAAWTTVSDHIRAEDQTYLTFPEWYIVFSADEYALHLAENLPSRFPFFASVRQYWQGYAAVCAVTKGTYEFNTGYHLMLYVIGVSFTVENGVKGIYEGTVGRLTEWTSGTEIAPGTLTAEDALARQYAKAYGDFIHAIPWFDFPYLEKLQLLWTETGWWGPNPLRKWERKLSLSAEFLIKTGYGALIGWGNSATYGAVDMEIYALATGVTASVLADFPAIHLVERLDNDLALITIPHYQPFTDLVPQLTAAGVHFKEFAGNDQIMLSAFAPTDWPAAGENKLGDAKVMFTMRALAAPDQQRIGLNIPVTSLHIVLAEMDRQGIVIEHMYDY